MTDITEHERNVPSAVSDLPRPYWASTTRATAPLEEVRRTVPGWGVDLNYDERTAVPMEDFDPGATGAHWDFPERQPEKWPREMSPEHGMLPPVFGTACPPKGISGAIRKYAYTLGEGKTSHWMLLMAADRIDVIESSVESAVRGQPDNPLSESGVIAEFKRHGIRSRTRESQRVDLKHQWMDPLIVAAPWLLGGYLAYRAGKALAGASRGSGDDRPRFTRPG
ncbi:MAG TPA: hypothetical protein VGB24_11055 [Longimicrobium sp.]|jgi:hypothetical protein|uniref:hypothetical protein n=1 Tax=Longimicrobium sp. TaxID=2029185 RepID=UPI002ED90902